MQALILAGGEGTRLRPLTSTVPKPVVPLVDRPFIAFMLDWLRGHGVDDVVMSCGHMADGVRDVLGDGSALGLRLRYLEEPRPLGTGGALKFAEDLLDERFLMLNGDVLTDIDISAQLAQHERTGARGDARAVPGRGPERLRARAARRRRLGDGVRREAGAGPDRHEQHLRRRLRARAVGARRCWSKGEPASIERDVFPRLVGNGLFGHVSAGYWKDIGTPERYLEATFDILEGTVGTEVAARMGSTFMCVEDGVANAGRIVPSALVESGCRIGGGRADRRARGARARRDVGEGTTIESSVVMQGAEIGAHCTLRGCIVAAGRGSGSTA